MRKKVILWGLLAAVLMRIAMAAVAVQLLAIIGLMLAGGILLLWVCWRMWRDLSGDKTHIVPEIEAGASAKTSHHADPDRRRFHVAGQCPGGGGRRPRHLDV
jgi:predicted tellurium resistance membrane protein TerC